MPARPPCVGRGGGRARLWKAPASGIPTPSEGSQDGPYVASLGVHSDPRAQEVLALPVVQPATLGVAAASPGLSDHL